MGGEDHTVWLWDVPAGRRLRKLKDFPALDDSALRWVFLSPDAKILVNAAGGPEFWDLGSGKCTRPSGPLPAMVSAAAFSPDSKHVAIAYRAERGARARIRLWDIATGKELPQVGGWPADVVRLTFTPDGKRLVVGCQDGTVYLCDASTGKQLRRFDDARGRAAALAVSSDGKLLAVGASTAAIALLDLATGEEVGPRPAHCLGVVAVEFSPDGRSVATVGDGDVRLWDAATSRQVRILHGKPAWIYAAAFSPDGRSLATAEARHGPGYVVRLWDAGTGHLLRHWRADGAVFDLCLAFSPDGHVLACASAAPIGSGREPPGVVRLYDPATGKQLRRLDAPPWRLPCVAFSPDGTSLATGGDDLRVVLWDPAGGRRVRAMARPPRGKRRSDADDEPPGGPWPASGLAFTPDGRTLAGMEYHSTLCLWDTATGKLRRYRTGLHAHAQNAFGRDMALSADGRLLATADDSNRVCVWDLDSGRQLRRFTGHRGVVSGLAFSPDGKRLASASSDTTVLIWNVSGLGLAPLTADELDRLWADLGGPDDGTAYDAVQRLAHNAERAVPFLAQRLRPVPRANAAEVARLIEQLDDRRFARREQAAARLEALRELAEPALRRALARAPAVEMRRRLEGLLGRLEDTNALRDARVLEALERADTPEARRMLEALAQGAPAARLTREAAAATRRPAGRATPKP